MSKTNHYGDGSHPSLDAQLTEKLHELISDDDVEGLTKISDSGEVAVTNKLVTSV